MPKKVRELRQLLKRAGFTPRPNRGGHSVWGHPRFPGYVCVSGNDGDDAKPYQERDVRAAIEAVGEES